MCEYPRTVKLKVGLVPLDHSPGLCPGHNGGLMLPTDPSPNCMYPDHHYRSYAPGCTPFLT